MFNSSSIVALAGNGKANQCLGFKKPYVSVK